MAAEVGMVKWEQAVALEASECGDEEDDGGVGRRCQSLPRCGWMLCDLTSLLGEMRCSTRN